MWLRTLFRSLGWREPRRKPQSPSGRWRVEPLEDRAVPSAYFAYDIGTLGGSRSQLNDINLHGQVVGSATAAVGPSQEVEHAFIWDRGTMIDLGTLGGPAYTSSAWGINDHGQVIGISDKPDPNGEYPFSRGFIVTPEDTNGDGKPDRWYRDNNSDGINDLMRDLGTLGGTYCNAYDINNLGQVVGMSDTVSGDLYSFRWQNGQMTSLGSLAGLSGWSYGQGINDSGRVVGVSGTSSGSSHGFRWQSGGGMTDLGTLPTHEYSNALAINNTGTAVGTATGWPSGYNRAVLWPATGGVVDLGTLPGYNDSDAYDINNLGQVVGSSRLFIEGEWGERYLQSHRAVVWSGGSIIALDDLMAPGSGWSFRDALAINDAGQIVGWGSRTGGTADSFLLSPVDLGLPLISISDVSVVEGSGGITNAVFTVTLSAPSTRTVSVGYATEDLFTPSGPDYIPTSGTLTFAPGQTSLTITVPVYADTLDELDETFLVRLGRTTNAAFADSLAVGTIRNDDPLPTLRVSNVSVIEGNTGTTSAVFTVTLTPAVNRERTVRFWTEGYFDQAYSDDFLVSGGEVFFAPGETTKTFTVYVFGDTIPEANETFGVWVEYIGSTSIVSSGTGTILNDEVPLPIPVVSDATVTEGNAGTTTAVFTVTLLMGPMPTPVTFTYQTANGSAIAGADYQAASGTITFAPGETQKTIAVTIFGDMLYENYGETFSLTVSNPTQLPLTQDTGIASIMDDDPLPTVNVGNVTAVEGNSGTTSFVFTVSLSAPSGVALYYDYGTVDETAWSGSDFGAAWGSINFLPGETSKTIMVSVNGDSLFEADETFYVQLYEYDWWSEMYIPVGTPGVGTILNDDQNLPLIIVADASVVEGHTGLRQISFTVSLSASSNLPVTVNFATANGTAAAGSDYQAKSGSVTFAPGETTKTITISVVGDRLGEANETFFINLSGATNATVIDGQAVGTISDDEPRISISDVSKAEGRKGKTTVFTFTVSLSVAYDQPVTMSFRTVNGTAKSSDSDYVAKTGTITFAPGETTKTITIEVKGDSKREADEYFYLDLFNCSPNSLFVKDRGIGTILNDD